MNSAIDSKEIYISIINIYEIVLNYQITEMQIELRILSHNGKDVDDIMNYFKLSLMDYNLRRTISLLLLPIYKINKSIAHKLYLMVSW